MAEVAKGIIDIEINTGSAASALQALQAQINAFNIALSKSNKAQGAFSGKYSRELQDAINKTGLFTAETIKLQTAAATLDKTLSKGKTSLGQYFSARFNKDGAIAAETMSLASERARRLQTQFIATSGAANGFQDALAVRPIAAFSSQVAVAGQRAEIMSAMFKQGTTQLINFGKNVQWAGRQLMVGFTVPLTIFGAVAGKTFMELEKQVVGFKKVYGDLFTTPADLEKNLEAVKGLAGEYTKYGIAVKDTIGLAAQAAAAGRQGAELTDSVTQATRLATLGQMDQNAALETTISLQSAFKLSGQDLADTINFLNMVENQTVVSLQDIATAIPRVAPVISGLGGDVKDLTVFLAAMQEGGVDASEGANALKSGLASLINPTKQATAMLSGFGINLEAIIQTNKGDLMATVQSFAQALGTLDQFSRQQALEQVFGKFQYAKLGALFENISREGSQAQQVIATLGYTTEQLASTADKELKTIEESFGVQLTGAVERFKLAIAPIGEIFVKLAIPLVNLATKIAEGFNGLSDGQKKFAAIGAVIIGVVVPAVTMLTGLFLNLVGTLAKMTQGVSLFGMGLIKGGPLGAIKALTQSSKYLSLAEMDAAMAAQQLAGSNEILNATLVKQITSANGAAGAIGNLAKAYGAMIATQGAAASKFPEIFGLAGASGAAARTSQVRIRGVQKRNSGGPIFMSNGTTVPGSGNTDTVPAMLTPGEFVVNKEATKNNLGLLHNINDTKSPQGLNAGGKAKGMQYFAKDNPPIVLNADLSDADLESINKFKPPAKNTSTSQVTQRLDNTTFAHMQENVLKVNDPKTISFFDSIYDDMKKNPNIDLPPGVLAEIELGKLNKWQGWRAVGNLGFDIDSSLNSALNGKAGVSPIDLINNLQERMDDGRNPYERMIKSIGITDPEDIRKTSNRIHRDVTRVLRNRSRFVKNVSDPDLYKIIPRTVTNSLVNSGYSDETISKLFSFSTVASDPTRGLSGMTAIRSGAIATPKLLNEMVKSEKIKSWEKALVERGPKKGQERGKGFKITFNDGSIGTVEGRGTNISSNTLNKILKNSKAKNIEELLKTFIKVPVKGRRLFNKGGKVPGYNAGAQRFNEGNIVPGTGNTDTVPAMLTPGEFVVNKEATNKNRQVLEQINSGKVEGYAKGGMIGKIAGALPMVGGLAAFSAGQPIAKAAGLDNEMANLAAGFAASSLAEKVLRKSLSKFSLITEEAASKTGMVSRGLTKFIPSIGNASSSLIKFAGPVGWIVTAGIAIKALGDSVEKSKKASIELTNAMYGSAERTKAMGEVFGRETNATMSKKASVEAALKSQISPEAEQTASEFMKTDLSKQMIAEIEAIKKAGGDAAIAMRNQLTSSIMAGVITPEEAGAIANDLGQAVNDKGLSIRIAGELTSLIGKDGENLLTNAASINAEITAKVDSTKLASDAQKLYDNLNPLQKAQKFFFGGEDKYKEEQQVAAISDLNAQALQKEAEARALLNLALQQGTIDLKTYNEQTAKLNELSKKNRQESLDANAKAFGFSSNEDLVKKAERFSYIKTATETGYDPKTGQRLTDKQYSDMTTEGSQDTKGKDAFAALSKNKELFQQQIIDSGMGESAAAQIVSGIQKAFGSEEVVNSGSLFGKMIAGQISLQGGQAISNMLSSGEIDTEAIDRISEKVSFIENIPSITKVVQIESLGEAELSGLYSIAQQIENFPDPITKNVLFKTLGFELTANEVNQFMALDPVTQKDLVYNFKVTMTQEVIKTAKQYTGGDPTVMNRAALNANKKINEKAMADFKSAITDSFKSLEPSSSTGSGGGADKTKDLLKSLMERFRLQEMLIDKEAEAYNNRAKQLNREIELEQRQVSLRQRGLDQLSKKEEQVNDAYNLRVEALDKVSESNSRITEQEKSRISLASALASGDIAGAAGIAGDMQQQSAQYQIEDARAALEKQRQVDLDALTVSINGKLMTRKGIEFEIEAIQDRIYNKGIELQGVQDKLLVLEDKKLAVAKEREKIETRMYLLAQQQAILDLKKGKGGKLNAAEQQALAQYKASYNQVVDMYNAANPGANLARLNYGGSVARMANGGTAYKGSTEAPPAIKMNNGFTVPGTGMTDKVSALLTPGEFVVRKPVADKNRGFLQALNSQIFPGMDSKMGIPKNNFLDGVESPRYSVPSSGVSNIPVANTNVVSTSSPMYNSTYNVNVNVSGTNASPDDIANVVMAKLSNQNRGNLRSSRY